MNLLLSGVQISRVDDTRFLGVVISSNLSWNKHIDVIVSKISKTVGLLSKVRHLLPNLGTRTLYMSLVEPYIGYCNIVWSQANASVYLDKIFKIQKKYCRIITFSDFRAHSEPLFKELNILNVYNMYKYQIALFMYKQLNGLTYHWWIVFPSLLISLFMIITLDRAVICIWHAAEPQNANWQYSFRDLKSGILYHYPSETPHRFYSLRNI